MTRISRAVVVTVLAVLMLAATLRTAPASLRVCADPDNMPFSNKAGAGFENAIAILLARSQGSTVEYVWWPQRRGFLRNTLDAGRCDVVIGYLMGADGVLTTAPYYRSTWVFVTRAGDPAIEGFDDPRLPRLRIGVPLAGDDGAVAPAAHAITRRGMVRNIEGYSPAVQPAGSPQPAWFVALTRRDLDVALAWGPVAGYFAAQARPPLTVTPVRPADDGGIPQTFDISMAVRRGDAGRRAGLDRFLAGRRVEIDRILNRFNVPRVDRGP